MSETQRTITDWQRDTFGKTTAWHAFQRMQKEYWELRDIVHAAENGLKVGHDQVAGELADVLITLYRVAECCGIDLHAATDAKMSVNRNRKWVVDETTGSGQHVD